MAHTKNIYFSVRKPIYQRMNQVIFFMVYTFPHTGGLLHQLLNHIG
jgi:hypothetical protein